MRLVLEDDLRRSRLTVLFRLLLAIPHFVWFVLWTVAARARGLRRLVRRALHRPRPALAPPLPRRMGALRTARVRVHVPRRGEVPGLHRARRLVRRRRATSPRRSAQSRWTMFFRGFLAMPGAPRRVGARWRGVRRAVLGWFYAIVRGRMPGGPPESRRVLHPLRRRRRPRTGSSLTDRYPFAAPVLHDRPPSARRRSRCCCSRRRHHRPRPCPESRSEDPRGPPPGPGSSSVTRRSSAAG